MWTKSHFPININVFWGLVFVFKFFNKVRNEKIRIFDDSNNKSPTYKGGSKHVDRDLIPYVVSTKEANDPDKIYMLTLCRGRLFWAFPGQRKNCLLPTCSCSSVFEKYLNAQNF